VNLTAACNTGAHGFCVHGPCDCLCHESVEAVEDIKARLAEATLGPWYVKDVASLLATISAQEMVIAAAKEVAEFIGDCGEFCRVESPWNTLEDALAALDQIVCKHSGR
jgi:hypothetical protein